MTRLTIGIFHACGDFRRARKVCVDLCKYLERYEPDHNYLYHDLEAPVTPALLQMRFDAILFDSTFLGCRSARPRAIFDEVREKYAFLAESDALRIAAPQDDYDHGELLDEWLESYNIDVVYSVLWDTWDLVYPRTRRRAELRRGLTGYVDDRDVEGSQQHTLPFAARPIDVSYRANALPPRFGRQGHLKARLGEKFANAVQGRGLHVDVSTRAQDVLLGEDWLGFLGRSKFVLGCEGGSSIWDPRGDVRDRTEAYIKRHPRATYDEVEAACFAGENREPPFTAVSPRTFEAAMLRCAQILVRAPYLGRLLPGRDYLCLEPDFSNVDDVLRAMADRDNVGRIIESSHQNLIATEEFRYSRLTREVMATLETKCDRTRPDDSERFRHLAEAHMAAVEKAGPRPMFSLQARIKRRVRSLLGSLSSSVRGI